ncbi:MAG: AAA family ATPase [Magnetococcales bacterium]|nr:AAA family ATPase [Magnetococcales bacterium]
MYLDHFGLERFPFSNSADVSLFYQGGRRAEVLQGLQYALTSGEGMTKVIGVPGSGKTVLSRMLGVVVSDTIRTLYLVQTDLTPKNILKAIAVELRLSIPPDSGPLDHLHLIQESLMNHHMAGQQVVVVIEEAHKLPLATLEEIRLLGNLETGKHKLFQVVLFGRPELDKRLSGYDMRQFRDRVTNNFRLSPLKAKEVKAYLAFRMHGTGYRGEDVFSSGAARILAHASGGWFGPLNQMAHKALLAAYVKNVHRVGIQTARTAVSGTQRENAAGIKRFFRPVTVLTSMVIGGGVMGWLIKDPPALLESLMDSSRTEQHVDIATYQPEMSQHQQEVAQPQTSRTEQERVDQLGVPEKKSPVLQTQDDVGIVEQHPSVLNNASLHSQDNRQNMMQDTVPGVMNMTAESKQDAAVMVDTVMASLHAYEQLPAEENMASDKPVESVEHQPNSVVMQPELEPSAEPGEPSAMQLDSLNESVNPVDTQREEQQQEAAQQEAAKQEAAQQESRSDVEYKEVSVLRQNLSDDSAEAVELPKSEAFIEERIMAGREWIDQTGPRHYTIRVMRVEKPETRKTLYGFFRKNMLKKEMGTVFIFPLKNKHMIIYHGDYPTFSSARTALEKLPKALQKTGAYIQSVRSLQSELKRHGIAWNE